MATTVPRHPSLLALTIVTMANYAWTREFENLSDEEILIVDRENEHASHVIGAIISYFWDQLLRFRRLAGNLLDWSNDDQLLNKEREYYHSCYLIFHNFELRAEHEYEHTAALHNGELQWREDVANHLSYELFGRGLQQTAILIS